MNIKHIENVMITGGGLIVLGIMLYLIKLPQPFGIHLSPIGLVLLGLATIVRFIFIKPKTWLEIASVVYIVFWCVGLFLKMHQNKGVEPIYILMVMSTLPWIAAWLQNFWTHRSEKSHTSYWNQLSIFAASVLIALPLFVPLPEGIGWIGILLAILWFGMRLRPRPTGEI